MKNEHALHHALHVGSLHSRDCNREELAIAGSAPCGSKLSYTDRSRLEHWQDDGYHEVCVRHLVAHLGQQVLTRWHASAPIRGVEDLCAGQVKAKGEDSLNKLVDEPGVGPSMADKDMCHIVRMVAHRHPQRRFGPAPIRAVA
jgi:hypothetical protein